MRSSYPVVTRTRGGSTAVVRFFCVQTPLWSPAEHVLQIANWNCVPSSTFLTVLGFVVFFFFFSSSSLFFVLFLAHCKPISKVRKSVSCILYPVSESVVVDAGTRGCFGGLQQPLSDTYTCRIYKKMKIIKNLSEKAIRKVYKVSSNSAILKIEQFYNGAWGISPRFPTLCCCWL